MFMHIQLFWDQAIFVEDSAEDLFSICQNVYVVWTVSIFNSIQLTSSKHLYLFIEQYFLTLSTSTTYANPKMPHSKACWDIWSVPLVFFKGYVVHPHYTMTIPHKSIWASNPDSKTLVLYKTIDDLI